MLAVRERTAEAFDLRHLAVTPAWQTATSAALHHSNFPRNKLLTAADTWRITEK